MRISPHFTLEEITRSRHTELITPPRAIPYPVLITFCRGVHEFLEPVRAHFGRTIIHSGYRSRALNDVVGGAPSSRHLGITQEGYFWAFDFRTSYASAQEVFVKIARGDLLCSFDRLCLYPHENRLHADGGEGARKLFFIDSGSGWSPITREAAGEM